ncbi:MAG: hypothetical protein V1652_03530 [bacterium]
MESKLTQLRALFIQNGIIVSEMEYTKGNYDNNGKMIKESLSTITTEYSEIGLYRNEMYVVFIIESQTFNTALFKAITKENNIQLYGFINFKQTLYPDGSCAMRDLMVKVRAEKYLQIQFDFQNIGVIDLYKNYCRLVHIFDKNDAIVVNQLNVDLKKLYNIPNHRDGS